MIRFMFLILINIISTDQCTYKSNLISIDSDVSMDDIKDPYRPTFVRLTSPGCPYSPSSQYQWEKAASLYPQVNFVTVDAWKNSKISSLFGHSINTPIHALFLANSSRFNDETIIGNTQSIQNSPKSFLDIIYSFTNLYQIAPPLINLSPMIIDSFYTAIDDPIILLYDSTCSNQVPFLNEWSRVANEVIFSNGVNPRIGMLDCSKYSNECQRWSQPYSYSTPRALIYSSKTGNYEVLDTYNNINSDKIDGLYANALSRIPRATPSPIPIPEIDISLPSTDGYQILENNEFREERTIESIRKEYKEAFVFPKSACKNITECQTQTLDNPNECPNIDPSLEDHVNSLKIINFLRKLAGLPNDVIEDEEWNKECYKTAMNMHKIGIVPSDHIIKDKYATPAYCGEKNNIQVSKDSLLSENSESVFEASYKLIIDEGSNNDGVVGHRRYLLHPNLKKIGIGYYPYKEENFGSYRMMRPAVVVHRIMKNNNLMYIEDSVPSNLNFISWPPEGPFPIEQLPSNWHISHPDFRNAKLNDIRIFVRRDDGAELKVERAYLEKNSVNKDALVIKMTSEALNKCQIMRTITVTIYNDNLKKIYRFSFDLFDNNEITEVCLYSNDKSKCPSTVSDSNIFGPGQYQNSIFSSSTNPVKVHIIEPIILDESEIISFSAKQRFFLIGETINGIIEIESGTIVDVQNPSMSSYIIKWNVGEKIIGKLETSSTAKSVNINIQDEVETISIYDLTFYTGRQTQLSLSKAIYMGENYDIYFTIEGFDGKFFVMASPSKAYQEFSCAYDSDTTGPSIIELWSIFDMHKQKTNKRIVRIYVSGIENVEPINLSAFIPGRKRDYQFVVVGGNIYFSCDMNISNVANSITFTKYRDNTKYKFEVYKAPFNQEDMRFICPMENVTINGAILNGDSSSTVIMPYLKGDQNAINFNDISRFNDIYPKSGTADSNIINAIPSGSAKSRCIITTSGTYNNYRINYDSEKKKYNPFIFRAAPGTEEKTVTLSLYDIPDYKNPQGPRDYKLYFENYQNLILDMPSVKKYVKVESYLDMYQFDNCGKVTFIGNDNTTPKIPFEITSNLILGNFNYGCVIVAPNVLVTGTKKYDGTWIQAKNLSVSANLIPTINNITVKDRIDIYSSTLILENSTLEDNIIINIKKTESWWPSISLQNTQFKPKSISIDLGFNHSSYSSHSKMIDDREEYEEYESHSLITGIDINSDVDCKAIKSKTNIINHGKFTLECNEDGTELIVIKGKENAPTLLPEGQIPDNDITTSSIEETETIQTIEETTTPSPVESDEEKETISTIEETTVTITAPSESDEETETTTPSIVESDEEKETISAIEETKTPSPVESDEEKETISTIEETTVTITTTPSPVESDEETETISTIEKTTTTSSVESDEEKETISTIEETTVTITTTPSPVESIEEIETISISKESNLDSDENSSISESINIAGTEEYSPEQTITPNPVPSKPSENIEILVFDENVNESQFNQQLTESFNKMENNTNSNNVIVIENIDNLKFNSQLSSNQFIKPPTDSTVEYNGGTLNLIIPEKVNVVLSDTEDSKLLIKGQGTVNIDFKEGTKSQSININTKSQINGSVLIIIPKEVISFSIDSIELESSSQIAVKKNNDNEEPINFTIKEITTLPSTKAKLSGMRIEKKLNIIQTAVLDIENADINEATINYDIYNYEKIDQPFLIGKFNSLPKSLILTKKSEEANKPNEKVEYPIISGVFENVKCEDLYQKIVFGESGFNSKICLDNTLLNSENKRLVVKFDHSAINDNNNDGSKTKMNAGVIIGIVIAVVVVIIAIVVVIVFIIKRMKNKKNMNNSSDNIKDDENASKNDNEVDDI